MALRGVVDVLIPRGGAGLIQRCVRESLVPVIETGTGNCHIYVHESADFAKARAIIMNAKTQRVGVCNACESLLVDESIADAFLPEALSELGSAGVVIHGDERVRGVAFAGEFVDATEEDWGCEYLALEISVKVMPPPCTRMRARVLPMAVSLAWVPRLASRLRSCTLVVRLPLRRSRPTSMSFEARGRCGGKRIYC